MSKTNMFVCSSAGMINVKLEGLNALKDAVSQATSWKDEAQVYLKNRQNSKEATQGVLDICSLQVLDCLSFSKLIYWFIIFCIFFRHSSIPRVLVNLELNFPLKVLGTHEWCRCIVLLLQIVQVLRNVYRSSYLDQHLILSNSNMQALVEKAQNLTVKFEETCLLQNYWLEAQTWTSMADELIKTVRSVLLCSNEAESSYPCRADYSRVLLSQCEEQRLKLNKALEEGSNLNLEFPAIVELQTLLTMTLWSIRTFEVLSSQSHLEVLLFPVTSSLETRFCSTDSKFQLLTLIYPYASLL